MGEGRPRENASLFESLVTSFKASQILIAFQNGRTTTMVTISTSASVGISFIIR